MKCTVISTVLIGLLGGVAYAADTQGDNALRAAYPILEARRAERGRAAEELKKPEKVAKSGLKAPPKKETKTTTNSSAFDPNAALLSTLPMAPAALSARKNELKAETAIANKENTPAREKPVAVAVPAPSDADTSGDPLRVGTARTPVGTSQVTLAGPFGNVLMRTLLSGEKVQLMVQYPGFGWEIFTDVEFKNTYRLQQTEPNCARFSKPGDNDNFYDICLDKSKLRVRAVGEVESLT